MNPKAIWTVVVAVAFALGLILGFWYGSTQGEKLGYNAARAGLVAYQNRANQQRMARQVNPAQGAQLVTQRALQEAAQAANPLLVENPLRKITVKANNPF